MDKENKLTFGKRFGYEPIEFNIQLDYLSETLKTDLYNTFLIYIYNKVEQADRYNIHSFRGQHEIIWIHYFRQQLDKFPDYDNKFKAFVYYHIFEDKWYKTYEFFEFIVKVLDKRLYDIASLINYINLMLERNNSGYRLVENHFVPISNKNEIEELKTAKANSQETGIFGLGQHLETAIELLSKKPKPDFRNSIKESISMVEAVCRTIEPSENTLGKALKKIENKSKLNPFLKSSFEKLYAYSNDKGGIRHALMDESQIELEDARFFLISCSAFSNYLIDKGRREGLIKIMD